MSTTTAPGRLAYVACAAALLALLVATVAVARIDLGPMNIVAALGIAFTKMLLVALIFMHVRFTGRMIWLFSAAGLFWLTHLIVLVMADVTTRVPGL